MPTDCRPSKASYQSQRGSQMMQPSQYQNWYLVQLLPTYGPGIILVLTFFLLDNSTVFRGSNIFLRIGPNSGDPARPDPRELKRS